MTPSESETVVVAVFAARKFRIFSALLSVNRFHVRLQFDWDFRLFLGVVSTAGLPSFAADIADLDFLSFTYRTQPLSPFHVECGYHNHKERFNE